MCVDVYTYCLFSNEAVIFIKDEHKVKFWSDIRCLVGLVFSIKCTVNLNISTAPVQYVADK